MPPLTPLLAQLDDQYPHSHQGQASSILSCHFPSILGNPCLGNPFLGRWLAHTHSDTHAQYNTEVNSSGTETSLWTNERTTRSVLRRCAQRPTTGRDHYLTFWSDWRQTEDITEKKNALPVTPFPNSLNLTWALGISEYFRYSFKDKKDSQLQLRQIWLFTTWVLY